MTDNKNAPMLDRPVDSPQGQQGQILVAEEPRLAKNSRASFFYEGQRFYSDIGIWSNKSVDKLSFDDHGSYQNIIKDCRFYFRHEPLAWSVLTKMVDLAINELVILPTTR
jgi:hypothetical protein